MKVIHNQVGDVTILRLHGKLKLGQVTWLQSLIAEATTRGFRKILLDFSGVSKIDDSCLRELATQARLLEENVGELKLLNIAGVDGFSLTAMTDFEIFNDETKALMSFS